MYKETDTGNLINNSVHGIVIYIGKERANLMCVFETQFTHQWRNISMYECLIFSPDKNR